MHRDLGGVGVGASQEQGDGMPTTTIIQLCELTDRRVAVVVCVAWTALADERTAGWAMIAG